MPSVDRVGRYFPLTIAACLPKGSSVVQVLLKADRWFMEIEQLALSCLDDTFELGAFDDALQALDLFSVLPAEVDPDVAAARDQPDRNAMALHFEPVQPGPMIWPQIAGCVLQALVPDYSLWLTNGSDRIQASLLVCAGLPSVERFSALLDGRWVEWSWQDHQVAAYFNTTEK
jgi:type VI secretion system protein ImpM